MTVVDSDVKMERFRHPSQHIHIFGTHFMQLAQRLTNLGLSIPTATKPLASYIPATILPTAPAQLFISGQVPVRDGKPIALGQVPDPVSIDLAVECARQCTLNALAAATTALDGDLDRIDRVLKLSCFVACGPDFTLHPKVANGASDLLQEIFDERGQHVRAAVGVPSLPLGVPVEIEFVFLLKS